MHLLILTPLKLEYQAVRKYLTNLQPITKDACNYEVGEFVGKHQTFQIAIRTTGAKNVTMALATEKAYQHFKPAVMLLVGVAGGVKDVTIGDVVIANKAYGYASGKETKAVHQARPNVFPMRPEILAVAERVDQANQWQHRLVHKDLQPTVFFAPIAADDKVIASSESTSAKILKKHYGDTAALDMEAIGFAEATFQYAQLKALIIRGISDLLDGKTKADESGSQPKAVAAAAAFAFELIYQLNFSALQIPIMELKAINQAVNEYIQPNLQYLLGESVELPTDPHRQLLWRKMQPAIKDEIEELEADPTDTSILQGIPNVIRKFLKGNDELQKELSALIEQIKKAEPTESPTFTGNGKVFYKSTFKSEGDMQIGDNQTINNYGNVDKQWNIKENNGDFNIGEK